MLGHLDHQPQQQAGKAQRGRRQAATPTAWLRDHFGMYPHPHVAQHKHHPHDQQPQHRMATARLDLGWMHLAIRRFNAKATPIGLANPGEGPVLNSPGGIQSGLALMASPAALQVVAHDGQIKDGRPPRHECRGFHLRHSIAH